MKNRITQLIESKNMTATEFASETGISQSSISQLKATDGNLSIDNLLKIKKRWNNVSLDWLILGEGEMYEQILNSQGLDLFAKQTTDAAKIVVVEDSIAEKMEKTERKSIESRDRILEEIENKKVERKVQPQYIDKKIEKILIFYNNRTFEEIIV